jgi:hypothetical protein
LVEQKVKRVPGPKAQTQVVGDQLRVSIDIPLELLEAESGSQLFQQTTRHTRAIWLALRQFWAARQKAAAAAVAD